MVQAPELRGEKKRRVPFEPRSNKEPQPGDSRASDKSMMKWGSRIIPAGASAVRPVACPRALCPALLRSRHSACPSPTGLFSSLSSPPSHRTRIRAPIPATCTHLGLTRSCSAEARIMASTDREILPDV